MSPKSRINLTEQFWRWCYATFWVRLDGLLLPRSEGVFRIVRGPGKGIRLRVNPANGGLRPLLGLYEPPLIRWIVHTVTPGSVAYDIGSCEGHIALIMARLVGRDGKVYTFEPDPLARQRMKANFDLNPILAQRIRIEPYYVGNQHDLARGLCTLDALCLDMALVEAPNVIKMDIEGAEVQALEGMQRIAARNFPHTFVECHVGPDLEVHVQAFFANFHVPTRRATPSVFEASRKGYNAWVYTFI
jgi:Methyltransferase FkbM domain